jgi:hypothetical protein
MVRSAFRVVIQASRHVALGDGVRAAVRIDVGPNAAGRPIAVRADPRQPGQIWWLRGHEYTVWVLMSSAELAGRIWLPRGRIRRGSDERRIPAAVRAVHDHCDVAAPGSGDPHRYVSGRR